LHAHLVFVPKYRRNVFTDEILTRCEEIMREVCTKANAELREFNGEADHVHLLIHYPPQVRLSALVGTLKGVSAHYLRKEYAAHIKRHLWGDHFWSPSYFALMRRRTAHGGEGIHREPEASRLRSTVQTHAPARVRAAQRSNSSRALKGRDSLLDHVECPGLAGQPHQQWRGLPTVISVTPPPAEAGGFSLRRVGVAKDQPGP
jgi:putative transposase